MAILGRIALFGVLLVSHTPQHELAQEYRLPPEDQRIVEAASVCQREWQRSFDPPLPPIPEDTVKGWEAWSQAMEQRSTPPQPPFGPWFNACIDRELRPKP